MNPRDAYAGGIKQGADAIRGISNPYLLKPPIIAQPFDNKSGTIKFMEELRLYFALKGVYGPGAYLAAVEAKSNNKHAYYIGDTSIDVVPQSVELAERKRDASIISPQLPTSSMQANNQNESADIQQRKDPVYLKQTQAAYPWSRKRLQDYVAAIFGQLRQRVYDAGQKLFSKDYKPHKNSARVFNINDRVGHTNRQVSGESESSLEERLAA